MADIAVFDPFLSGFFDSRRIVRGEKVYQLPTLRFS